MGLIFSGLPGFSAADTAVAALSTKAAVAASKINSILPASIFLSLFAVGQHLPMRERGRLCCSSKTFLKRFVLNTSNYPSSPPLPLGQHHKGGFIMLDKLLGGAGRGGMSPITMALLGVLAYRTLKGKGRLAEMLGRSPAGGGTPGANPYGGNAGAPEPRNAGGGLLGGLGGLLGGGALSGGLQDLLRQFQQHGQGDKANPGSTAGRTRRSPRPSLNRPWAMIASPG